jgi:group I intron endonuclease
MKINYSLQELKNAGVYSIVHLESGKRYIGSTKSFHYRMLWHRSMLNKGTHDNKVLQEAWTIYKKEAFSFEILEIVLDKDLRIEREQYWMDFYQAVDTGFNIGTSAVNPMLGNTHTPEAKEKIRQKALGRKMSESTKQTLSKVTTGVAKISKRKVNPKTPLYIQYAKETGILNRMGERHQVNTYYLKSPDGIEYITTNLAEFCREHCLTQSHLRSALKGTGFYKGWTGRIERFKNSQ